MSELSVSGYIPKYTFLSKIKGEIFNRNLKMCPGSDHSVSPPLFIIQKVI